MGWLRSRVRLWAWLALIALAMNLGLAFGHHHFDELATGHLAAAADHPASAGHPHDHSDGDHHGSPAAHPCFACVVVTAAVLTADPPTLPAPSWTKDVGLTTAFFGLRDSKRTSFEARAPPLS
jgi:hypothetical protein